ncbi:NAD(FAD)-dependent dehydrogenase [Rhizobium leguminosarum bv. trifolii]|uniref:NAD(FAD)-dependent dehydrogenase n=1 Tax=Rhizobium leguminosarum bv. trifolii TaxID=386 RepID=A0A3E1BJD3_RHILT|nr:FAD-dependent oxidoreductase [Rhizobium leguminosarum]RFB91357.1 NAD(FAD)-dependent dehydrogenase [Rhizobium leguminosarum bv. trifolii]RFB92982.1 NAD(FAD)-dependent dehydrogenase [Rhizobium leguminosarum bv. trifolii]
MTTPTSIVVAGAGQAGLQIAASLRQAGYDGSLVLVGDEAHLPYQRPPLSKAFLKRESDADKLLLRANDFFTTNAIDLALGGGVESIDRTKRRVVLKDGLSLPYDKLAIATGVRARPLELVGARLANVHTLRSIGDANALLDGIEAGGDIVIVGGGFIGLEVAASAASLGKKVTVLEASPRVMGRAVAPETSAFFESMHAGLGVSVRTSAQIAKIRGDERATGVELCDGTVIPCDLVLIGVGAVPNVEIASTAGIACANGVVVDAQCRTSDPDILAVGDCASHPNPFGNGLFRLESVQNAIDQSKVAAGTMLGGEKEYNVAPWFWSDQGPFKLQTTGLPIDVEERVIRGSTEDGKFSVFHLRSGRITAVDSVNAPADHMISRRLVAARTAATAGILGDPSTDLKTLL